MKKMIMAICLLLLAVGAFAEYNEGDICSNISWTDNEGNHTSIYEQTAQGKVVLIFWGSSGWGGCVSAAPKVQALWDNTFGPNADSEYAGKSYFIATNNWPGINYPYSTALYNQSGGFANGYIPLFGIIGQDNKVYYNDNGTNLLSSKLKGAIDGWDPNFIIVDNPIGDQRMGYNEILELDLNQVFSTISGNELNFEILEVSNPDLIEVQLTNSILTINSSDSPTDSKISVKASSGDYSAIDKFDLSVRADNCSTILDEGFENGIPEGWLNIDNDGDNKKWKIASSEDQAYSGKKCVYSASFNSPDNWLITPKVSLNSGGLFSYWVGAQKAEKPAEHYGIYISETGTNIEDFELIFEETITAKKGQDLREMGNYHYRLISIPEVYDNKEVYFAIRHFDCEQYKIKFDDIKIEGSLAITENENISPKDVVLFGNYPNPFNPNTTIAFKLNNATKVKLTVFDVKGQLVEELLNKKLTAGVHNVDFNASKLNSGTYYYKLEAGGVNITKKMLLIK